MMRSLWSGVAGLTTHQLEMDVIGNNIANVNTTAYKSQATGFADIFYQTVRNGTGSGDTTATTNVSQLGYGNKVASIYTNISKSGSMQTTGNAFDLMITGDSFFVVSSDASTDPATRNFSRDGAFTIDAEGSLVTQNNGFYVLGIMGDGNIPRGGNVNLTNLKLISDDTMTIDGTATSASYFRGNIDSLDHELSSDEGKTLRLEVFGRDGEIYTLKYSLTDGGDDADNTFNLSLKSIQDSNGNLITNTTNSSFDLVYSKNTGRLVSAGGSANGMVHMEFGGQAGMIGPIDVDFTNTSNFASLNGNHTSSFYGYRGDTQGLNQGYANGTMTGLSVTDNGSIFAKYSNGQTVKIAQVAVAEFNNAMGLEKVGDNLYAQSLNSGEAMIMDITYDGGYMTAGVLESSNVDLAKEFTDMITTQRGFQANSKVIITSDEMLQILKQLKR
ncbi:flagellar hook-basal body complex protein [Butyrivibrio sp. X503]|uniref:flagellar hook protein FlgE n=1 Tax=Butyrivibrio sp. X503 TaxID=2364878 RepID=UPI000EA9FA7F|nr:flagellar hook-basal body complex protein [Butyrivibrio sp. X503]RKM56406.1 flagellar hook-basal body complex protein [Butyrivibrio sp. X503]